MGIIKLLSQSEAQKIAAGEVVERPANIVKELIENSLDAGATSISLFVCNGGKTLIRVVDNGSGMDSDDARCCLERYATSKITTVLQLEEIHTFGFRGEALASIAAVSTITLRTKTVDAQQGIEITVTDNGTKKETAVACTVGTDICITDLFYSVPARKKFLKKDQTEWRHIQQLFQAFCLQYPAVQFKLFSEDRLILHCASVDSLIDRCTQLWDHQTTKNIVTIDEQHTATDLKIRGVISNHQTYRYDRTGIFFFVNNRWVKNYTLGAAFIKGYANVIPKGRYPIACISVVIDPTEVDINVHPRKEEVTFLHPRRVEQFIQQTVKKALECNVSRHINKQILFNSFQHNSTFDIVQPMSMMNQQQYVSVKPKDFEHIFMTEPFSVNKSGLPSGQLESITKKSEVQQYIKPDGIVIYEHKDQTDFIEHNQQYELIGQYKKTYLLIEESDGLFLLDQHAAHERVLYEQFSKRFKEVPTINLIFPHLVTLSEYDLSVILPYLFLFHDNGIGIEPFGVDQLLIQSTPVYAKDVVFDELVKQVVGWIVEYKSLDIQQFTKKIHEKLQAQMACKAAVKAGDVLTHEKMVQLLFDLDKTENRFSCPHGRPTGWLLSIDEIEKKFKRKL